MVKRIHWTPQLVNKFWDGVAQTELDNLSFGKIAGPKFIELISDFLAPDGRHLDFGAGSGHVLQLLLDRGLNSAGFDPSPDRQASLIEKIGTHPNFLGVKGIDCNEQFDVVLLMEVVEHVLDEDFDKVLDSVVGFVKPGGYLIVSTPNNENLETASVFCPVSGTFFHPWQHVRSFTPSSLDSCLKKYGLKDEFIALADFSSDVELVEKSKHLSRELQSLLPLLNNIDRSIDEFNDILIELGQIDDVLKAGSPLRFWQKLLFHFKLALNHRKLIGRLHSVSHRLSHRYDETSRYILSPLRNAIAIDTSIKNTEKKARPTDGIDLRIGKETTIVYVGKKL